MSNRHGGGGGRRQNDKDTKRQDYRRVIHLPIDKDIGTRESKRHTGREINAAQRGAARRGAARRGAAQRNTITLRKPTCNIHGVEIHIKATQGY